MKQSATVVVVATVAGLGLLSDPVWAHHFMDSGLPGTFGQGLLSGLAHPVIGLDHAAFIVAIGFFLAPLAGGTWGIAAMIGGSLLGAALHLGGLPLPGGELGVALSVMLAGGLLIVRREIGLPALAGGLALAGVLHGYAYAESIFGAEPTPLGAYLIGFSLTQYAVASAALFGHRHLVAARERWAAPASLALGAAVSVVGAVYLASVIAA